MLPSLNQRRVWGRLGVELAHDAGNARRMQRVQNRRLVGQAVPLLAGMAGVGHIARIVDFRSDVYRGQPRPVGPRIAGTEAGNMRVGQNTGLPQSL